MREVPGSILGTALRRFRTTLFLPSAEFPFAPPAFPTPTPASTRCMLTFLSRVSDVCARARMGICWVYFGESRHAVLAPIQRPPQTTSKAHLATNKPPTLRAAAESNGRKTSGMRSSIMHVGRRDTMLQAGQRVETASYTECVAPGDPQRRVTWAGRRLFSLVV